MADRADGRRRAPDPAARRPRRAGPRRTGPRRVRGRPRDVFALALLLAASVLASLRFAPGVSRLEMQITDEALPAPSGCPDAAMPAGWAVRDGYPYVVGSISGSSFNPQTVAILAKDSLAASGPASPDPGKECLARWAAAVLLDHARRVTFRDPDGRDLSALTYPYPFDFSANPAVPSLPAGWLSGLAQGSVLDVMSKLYDRTGDPRYLQRARETFHSFLLPPSLGGFVTTSDGLTYLQEYPTAVPSYVLNGHSDAAVSVAAWARRTGDPVARDLADRAVAALRRTTALEEVTLPTGVASSYDLLRGYPAAPLRAVAAPGSGSPLDVRSASLTDAAGGVLSPLRLAVARRAAPAPDLFAGAGFGRGAGAAGGGLPAGWRSVNPQAGSVAPGPPRADGRPTLRLTAHGTGTPMLYRDVPASAVTGGRLYTASWTAIVARVPGTATSAARVVLATVCGARVQEIAAADVRSTTPVVQSIEGRARTGCGLRLTFTKADPPDRRMTVDLVDPALRAAEPVGPAVAPSYPLSVLAVPTVVASITYTGAGRLQARFDGRWIDVGALPASGHHTRTARLQIPAYLQGRNVNLRYHDDHVELLTRLYRDTGDPGLRGTALSWMRYAPSTEGHRALLAAAAPVAGSP
jgi:hypothetical protein